MLNCLKSHHITHDRIYAPASTLYSEKWHPGIMAYRVL